MVAMNSQQEQADAIIVGSGAAGSLLAAKLAAAGKRVVILEGGPSVTTDDMWSSQIWSRRLHGTPFPALTAGTAPVSVTLNSGWGTGGSAAHHFATWFRLHEEDFRFNSLHGAGLDWPITYEDLRPYYDQIQEDVGISGDSDADLWSPPGEPYPLPPLPVLPQGEAVKRGFDALDIPAAPMPLAILSEARGDRAACINDGWCAAGCPIGALANPQVTYLQQALADGAELINDAVVSRVLTDDSGTVATGVEVFDASGSSQIYEASVVALGAYAIENPRILLNSATDRHPDGLANGSGAVGAYMMAHNGGAIYGLFEEETNPYLGRSGGEVWSQEQYATDPENGYLGGFQWLCATTLKPNDLLGVAMTRPDLFGADLDAFLTEASRHMANIIFIGHDLPVEENRVHLIDQVDGNGVPLAMVVHEQSDNAAAMKAVGLALGEEIMRAAGSTEVWNNPNANQHIMGGAIMGDDSTASVTNEWGQTHEVPNLFVLGSSLFPTSGAVNPTFTIHALTLRTAEYLVDQWNGIVQ